MTANTPQSRKGKGRKAQQQIREMVLDTFPLEEDDVLSRSMGAGGTDLHLSPVAHHYFPFAIEIKCQEKVRLWESWKQACDNAKEDTPLLVIKKNRQEPLAVLKFEDLLELLKEIAVNYKSELKE